ncbi:hypothetical protein DFH27DRAFT_250426 [Peziza echinospora]|nr:hypothetical protein DFH27DRAFT_250426 [Peziza echinospora]
MPAHDHGHAQRLETIIHSQPPTPGGATKPSTHLLHLRESLTAHITTLLESIAHAATAARTDDSKWRLMALVPITYLARAVVHERLGYHDLACSDAYRAMLAVDRVVEWRDEEAGEGFDKGLELEGGEADVVGGLLFPELGKIHGKPLGGGGSFETEAHGIALLAHYQLTRSLVSAGCLAPAHKYATTGAVKYPEAAIEWARFLEKIRERHEVESSESGGGKKTQLRIRGVSKREVYPWNNYEPDRYSPAMLSKINKDFAASSLYDTADEKTPWCEVRCVDLPVLVNDIIIDENPGAAAAPEKTMKQLGVFALRDIPGGKQYFKEKSALVNCTFQGYDWENGSWKCEFCTKLINPEPGREGEEEEGETFETFFECEECEEEDVHTLFCSEACRAQARELYHPALCGRRWEWLHREVVKVREVTIEELLEKKNAAVQNGGAEVEEDVADDSALYALLLLKAWGMALTQGKHPLQLPEVEYLYGAGKKRTTYPEVDGKVEGMEADEEEWFVPFDFHQDVVVPHMILEELGVDILPSPPTADDEDENEDEDEDEHVEESDREDDISTSTLNMLNKFKSVASLSRSTNTTIHPPITTITLAVHPLYSLHNHVCDPNVHWLVTDSGEAVFTALSEEQKFWRKGQGASAENMGAWRACWAGGVRKGEELFSSYVDPGLGVEARRKRIWTTLGGACWCDRCVREAGER